MKGFEFTDHARERIAERGLGMPDVGNVRRAGRVFRRILIQSMSADKHGGINRRGLELCYRLSGLLTGGAAELEVFICQRKKGDGDVFVVLTGFRKYVFLSDVRADMRR